MQKSCSSIKLLSPSDMIVRLNYKNGSYQGETSQGKMNGQGVFLWDDGTLYYGKFGKLKSGH